MDITTKNFDSKLASLVRSTTTQRDNLQSIIEFGFSKYSADGDTTYLTKAMRAVMSVRAFRTETLKNYIKHHANLTWAREKKGSSVMVWRKAEKGTPNTVKGLECVWYQFDNKGEAQPDLDVLTRTKILLKAMTKEGVKVKEGQEGFADIIQKHLQAALTECNETTLKA